MTLTVKTGCVPPGGWHFPAAPGVILRADDHKQLVQTLHAYRIRTGGSTVAVVQEIDRYVCDMYPSYCNPVTGPVTAGMDVRVSHYAAQLASQQPQGGYTLVTTTEADRRAAICAMCKLNVPWRSGCGSCNGNTRALLLAVRKMRTTPVDGRLQACAQCGGETGTMIHMPIGAGGTGETEGAPDGCWRRT